MSSISRQVVIATCAAGCLVTSAYVWLSTGTPKSPNVAVTLPPSVGWIESSSPQALSRDATPSLPDMRKLAKDRKSPAELRVQAIYHIAKQQDQGSMDLLIDLLDDPLPLVRGRAAGAIASILGTDFSFRPEDNKVQRREVVNGIRRYWSTRKRPSPLVSAKLDR